MQFLRIRAAILFFMLGWLILILAACSAHCHAWLKEENRLKPH